MRNICLEILFSRITCVGNEHFFIQFIILKKTFA